MVLITIVVCMLLAIGIGKRSEKFGFKQYLIAALLALIQVGVAMYHMLNMEKPPLY